MSRFKRSPGVVLPPVQAYSPAPSLAVEPLVEAGGGSPEALSFVSAETNEREPQGSMVESAGLFILCAYLIAAALTDVVGRYVGGKLYLSAAGLMLLPVFWIISPNRLRFLRHNVGRFMLFFLFWMIIDIPFSTYRHGSFDMLREYIPRSFAIFVYILAFTTNMRQCRRLMLITIGASFLELLSCMQFGGYSDDGRYRVVNTIFASNSNELAMELLLGIVNFAFLLYGNKFFVKIAAAGMIGISSMYMLKTGSRGCFIAALCYGAVILILSRRKIITFGIAILVAMAAFASAPTMALDRLKLLIDPASDPTSSAMASQEERKELLRRSLLETAKHPVFGVGPNAFPDAVAGEKLRRGEYAPWLGTHNSYTQVSAECGIPAFIAYCGVIFLCFRLNYRLLKLSRRDPAVKHLEGFAITLFSSTIVYAVCTFFFHMAYTGVLPSLAGLTLAVHFAAGRETALKPLPEFRVAQSPVF